MAGFFGLFNYEKEGPGIHKDGPRKKTFVVFFETFFRNFWKFITINLVYGLLNIPILTNGLSAVGITNVTRNIARDKHSFGMSDFFETIKKNFKQSLIAGIINVLVTIILAFDIYFFFMNTKGIMSSIGLGISLGILFIFSIMNFYIWTMIITFKFTLRQIYKNSFKFVFINMKMNLLCGVILLLVYALFLVPAIFIPNLLLWTIEVLLFICMFPSFKSLLIQYCTFPSIKKFIIDPYYEEHPEEDIERRKALGIDVGGDEVISEEEIVFDDKVYNSADKD